MRQSNRRWVRQVRSVEPLDQRHGRGRCAQLSFVDEIDEHVARLGVARLALVRGHDARQIVRRIA